MSTLSQEKRQAIIEAALMVTEEPLTIASLQQLFSEEEKPTTSDIQMIFKQLRERHEMGGIELKETASGFRFQAKAELSPWLAKLWAERAPRYSRAFLETLAIIAYKQPVTRAEIEEIRGVTVSSPILKTLQEREWIRMIGHREVPGRPALYGTTKKFLDDFNLKSLTALPALTEFISLENQDAQLNIQLALTESEVGPQNSDVLPLENEPLTTESN